MGAQPPSLLRFPFSFFPFVFRLEVAAVTATTNPRVPLICLLLKSEAMPISGTVRLLLCFDTHSRENWPFNKQSWKQSGSFRRHQEEQISIISLEATFTYHTLTEPAAQACP
jgi:zona occludens toxin (predicted ATPase)